MSKLMAEIPQRKFALVDVKKDGSAETYIYKEVDEQSKREGLWASLLAPSVRFRRLGRKVIVIPPTKRR